MCAGCDRGQLDAVIGTVEFCDEVGATLTTGCCPSCVRLLESLASVYTSVNPHRFAWFSGAVALGAVA